MVYKIKFHCSSTITILKFRGYINSNLLITKPPIYSVILMNIYSILGIVLDILVLTKMGIKDECRLFFQACIGGYKNTHT